MVTSLIGDGREDLPARNTHLPVMYGAVFIYDDPAPT